MTDTTPPGGGAAPSVPAPADPPQGGAAVDPWARFPVAPGWGQPLPGAAPQGWVVTAPSTTGRWDGGAVAPAATPAAPTRPRNPLQRAAAGAVAAVAALGKWGLLLLKIGKFGPMLISMGVSVLILGRLFGWQYGAGLVGLIFVHELGHVIAARIERVPASLPFFLGPFGAVIRLKAPLRDARQDAVIAIGGPLLGTLGAVACAVIRLKAPLRDARQDAVIAIGGPLLGTLGAVACAVAAGATSGRTHELLLALAYVGFFLNLFNLTPMQPFDGGRVAGAVSVWLNVAGVAIMGGLILVSSRVGFGVNPFIVVLFLLGCLTTFQRFRARHVDPYTTSVPGRTRALIAAAWVGLIITTAIGMSVSHRLLVDAGTIDTPSDGSAATATVTAAQAQREVATAALDARALGSQCATGLASPACTEGATQAASDAAGLASDVHLSGASSQAVDAAQRLEDDLVGFRIALLSGDRSRAATILAGLPDDASAATAAGLG